MSQWLAERAGALLERRTTRRGLLARTTLAGSALVVAPSLYVLRPVTAYAAICNCGGQPCNCGSACCDGYTEFCCSMTGLNACPPGSFGGGWWKADGSPYCDGPRYYVDCHSTCTCGGSCAGGSAFCGESCDPVTCGCANGNCGLRKTGCVSFRYGQCNQHIGCSGRIVCRTASCEPPWLTDRCTTTPATDNATALHTAACVDRSVVGLAGAPDGKGYWIAQSDGGVFAYGSAGFQGSAGSLKLGKRRQIVAMAPDLATGGYWLGAGDGGIFAFNAPFSGSLGDVVLNKPVVGMAAASDGSGYWLVASDGGVFAFGVPFWGSTGAIALNHPIVAMAATPDSGGYWLAAADGGLFAFGNAVFHGSLAGETALAAPIVDMVPTPDGGGYWLLGADGGVFAFGNAPLHGGMSGLAGPVAAMAVLPGATGYWLLGRDGIVHQFGDAAHYGDLRPPS